MINFMRIREKLHLDSKEILIYVFFIMTLIPIIYVGLHNYETGDDYWYGVYAYRAWVETGSLWQVMLASCRTVAEFYRDWQGTWFTMFLFTLSPNMWGEHAYYITVFIALALLVCGISKLIYFYLWEQLDFSKSATALINCLLLYLMIQYVPRTTSAFFWYNGVMHYSVPLYLSCSAIVHSHQFLQKGNKKPFVWACVEFALLGGGSYLAPLAAFLAVVLMSVYYVKIEKKESKYKVQIGQRIYWMLLPLVLEFTGLAVSFMAPGNSVRGGEEFGFSLKWVFQTIYYAIDRGIYLGEDYFTDNPLFIFVFFLIVVVVWYSLDKLDMEKYNFSHPFLFVVYTNALYWAMYTPEIYSRSDVSGGVHNTYQQVFLLVNLANIAYVGGSIQKYWKRKKGHVQIIPKRTYWIAGLVMGLICFTYEWVDNSITTTNQYCIAYVSSGKMDTYVKVRDEQYRILTDPTIQDAIVPENGADYPVLNMVMSEEPHGYRNLEKEKYYNKNSIATYWVE